MRKLTKQDIENIVGSTIKGCRVEAVRIKGGPFHRQRPLRVHPGQERLRWRAG